jgi:adenine phosphoribosyltransferase
VATGVGERTIASAKPGGTARPSGGAALPVRASAESWGDPGQPRADWTRLVVDVPDFPKPGIAFKDITPLLAEATAYASVVDQLTALAPDDVDLVVGMEARGFLFAAPLALRLGAGFAPVRKPGKLPRATVSASYTLEYRSETLTMHADAVRAGQRVLIVDDVLATGGTALATAELVAGLGGVVAAVVVLIELGYLDGRSALRRAGVADVRALLRLEV